MYLNVADSVVFLWHFQDESSSTRPDIFNDFEDGANGEGSSWAESWAVLKILRGHLQVRYTIMPILIPTFRIYSGI